MWHHQHCFNSVHWKFRKFFLCLSAILATEAQPLGGKQGKQQRGERFSPPFFLCCVHRAILSFLYLAVNSANSSDFVSRQQRKKEKKKKSNCVQHGPLERAGTEPQYAGEVEARQGAGLVAGAYGRENCKCSKESLRSKLVRTGVPYLHREHIQKWRMISQSNIFFRQKLIDVRVHYNKRGGFLSHLRK